MSKPSPPIDWRYRAVAPVAKDSVMPDGTIYKKGTPISVTTFFKHGDKSLRVGDPSAPALFLSQSHKAYEQAMKVHPFTVGVPSGDESIVSERVYDYLEYISASIVFAITALESFANEEIPDDFVYETVKPSSGLLVSYQKGSIERFVSLDEKLATVLPKAASKPSPKGTTVWEKYMNMRRLRDRIIHLKSEDKSHSKADDLYPGSIWNDLLAPKQQNYPLTAKTMILQFRDKSKTHWLKYCPF